MTFGEKLRNYIAAAKGSAPAGSWNAEAWVKAVNTFVEVERPIGKNGKAKPAKRAPLNKMTDDEFMLYLKEEPAFVGIDIDRELGKIRVWCKAQGKGMSRMRIINWLNRADRTLTQHGRDSGARASSVAERTVAPPHGWQEFMKARQREWTEKNGNQYDAPGTDALRRHDFFGMPKEWRDACRKELGGQQ